MSKKAKTKIKRKTIQIAKWTKGHIPFPVAIRGVSNIKVSWVGGRLLIEPNFPSQKIKLS